MQDLNGKQCCNRNRICTVPCKRVGQVRSSSLQKFVRTLLNGRLTLPSDRVKLTLIWGTVQALFYYSWPCWLTLSLLKVTKGKFDKNPKLRRVKIFKTSNTSWKYFQRNVIWMVAPQDFVHRRKVRTTSQTPSSTLAVKRLMLFYNLPNALHGIKCIRLTFNSFWLTSFKGTWRHHSNRHNLRLPHRNMGRFSGNCSIGWTVQVSQFIYQSVLSTSRNSSSTNEKTPDWRGNLYGRRSSTVKHITNTGFCHEMLEF